MEVIKNPFRISFKILNFFGFFLAENCKLRWKFYGTFVFFFVIFHYFAASVYRFQDFQNLNNMVLPTVHIIFSLNLCYKIVNFKWNEKKILEILKTFDELNLKVEKVLLQNRSDHIKKFILSLLFSDVSLGTIMGISIMLFSQENSFLLPVFYNNYNDFVYYILFAISFPNVVIVGISLTSVESIFTVSLIMMEVHFKELTRRIEKLAEMRKEELKELVKYQVELVR